MTVPLLACLLALVLAGLVAAATPGLLRWCPLPLDVDPVPPAGGAAPPDGDAALLGGDAAPLDGNAAPLHGDRVSEAGVAATPEVEVLRPFVELATARFRWWVFGIAAVSGSLAFTLTSPAQWAVWAPLSTIGALLGLVDLRTTFLPLRLNYLALALALAGAAASALLQGSWQPLLSGGVAGIVAAGLFWLVWRIREAWLGFGDVRLAGLIGVVTGSESASLPVWAFLLGSLAGGVWGIVTWARRGRDGEFPYGPALLLGPFLALVVRQVVLPG